MGRTSDSRAPVRLRSFGLGSVAARCSSTVLARARARPIEQERRTDREKGSRREPGHDGEDPHEYPRDLERLRYSQELPRELVAQRCVRLLARDPGHEDSGGRGKYECRNLRHEAVADRQQPVALQGADDGHSLHRRSDRQIRRAG